MTGTAGAAAAAGLPIAAGAGDGGSSGGDRSGIGGGGNRNWIGGGGNSGWLGMITSGIDRGVLVPVGVAVAVRVAVRVGVDVGNWKADSRLPMFARSPPSGGTSKTVSMSFRTDVWSYWLLSIFPPPENGEMISAGTRLPGPHWSASGGDTWS